MTAASGLRSPSRTTVSGCRSKRPARIQRYFVNAAGDERAYTFKRNESRRLTKDDCSRQFAEPGYCWDGPPFQGPTRPAA